VYNIYRAERRRKGRKRKNDEIIICVAHKRRGGWCVCSRSVSRVTTSSKRMIFAGSEFFPLTHYRRLRARFENPENPRGHSHDAHNVKWLYTAMRLDMLLLRGTWRWMMVSARPEWMRMILYTPRAYTHIVD